MNIKLYPILIITCLSSCYSYSANSYQEQQNNSKSTARKETNHSFFWSLQEKYISSKCINDKIIKIDSKDCFLNYFARIYTLVIYRPRTLEIE